MNPEFAALIRGLPASLDALMSCPPITGGATPNYGMAPRERAKGVYLFSENGEALYVGRSNRLLERYKNHWMASKSEREAAFAFKLARRETGFEKPTYKQGEESRKGLVSNPIFLAAFRRAKERIRVMEYRWVLAPHSTRQCLLEIYVVTALNAKFNDFDNH
jgi:hypothetical protein